MGRRGIHSINKVGLTMWGLNTNSSLFLNKVLEERKSNVKTKQLWENLTAQKENPTEVVRINWVALVLYENAL